MKSNRAVRTTGPLHRAGAVTLAGLALTALGGCGTAGTPRGTTSGFDEARADAPFTHEQILVEAGGRLFVTDGCSGCHSLAEDSRFGPSFAHLAGSHVTLRDGRTVLVDEAFLHAALTDPAGNAVRGYSPEAMIAAVKRLGLAAHREAVAALAAFIEQIGPEG